jgi:site-specific recombinase XerD
MNNPTMLGPWIKRFLQEYLISVKNLASNTRSSYRDTLCLLLPFIARQAKIAIEQLKVEDVSAERVKAFLLDLEQTRHCSISTRNQRLAAICSLAKYIGIHSPEHLQWCGEIRVIPSKKGPHRMISYLEKAEMKALLKAAEGVLPQQRRDHALLFFLYNTGARADEAAQLTIANLNLVHGRGENNSSVDIRGKGNKIRRCPLWPQTVNEITALVKDRAPAEHVFLNRCGKPITRFGIYTLVERYVQKASKSMPSLTKKHISPHCLRHTCATHLLQSKVDINTIRAWLGHVSINTTSLYAETDLEMKAKALALCEIKKPKTAKHWKEDIGLMAYLKTLK